MLNKIYLGRIYQGLHRAKLSVFQGNTRTTAVSTQNYLVWVSKHYTFNSLLFVLTAYFNIYNCFCFVLILHFLYTKYEQVKNVNYLIQVCVYVQHVRVLGREKIILYSNSEEQLKKIV